MTEELKDGVSEIFQTSAGILAVRNSDACICVFPYSNKSYDLDPENAVFQLPEKDKIFHNTQAYAIVSNKELVTWGPGYCGGKIPADIKQRLKNDLQTVYPIKSDGFIAVRESDGDIFHWGNTDLNPPPALKKQIRGNLANLNGSRILVVTAVKESDRKIVSWGRDGQTFAKEDAEVNALLEGGVAGGPEIHEWNTNPPNPNPFADSDEE